MEQSTKVLFGSVENMCDPFTLWSVSVLDVVWLGYMLVIGYPVNRLQPNTKLITPDIDVY